MTRVKAPVEQSFIPLDGPHHCSRWRRGSVGMCSTYVYYCSVYLTIATCIYLYMRVYTFVVIQSYTHVLFYPYCSCFMMQCIHLSVLVFGVSRLEFRYLRLKQLAFGKSERSPDFPIALRRGRTGEEADGIPEQQQPYHASAWSDVWRQERVVFWWRSTCLVHWQDSLKGSYL